MKYINTCRCIVIMIYRSTTSHMLQDFSHGRKPDNWWTTTFLKTQEISKQTKLACEEIIEELKVEKAWVLRDRVLELILGSQETRFINLDSTIFSNLWWKKLPCVLVHGGGVHQRTWSMFIANHNAFEAQKGLDHVRQNWRMSWSTRNFYLSIPGYFFYRQNFSSKTILENLVKFITLWLIKLSIRII